MSAYRNHEIVMPVGIITPEIMAYFRRTSKYVSAICYKNLEEGYIGYGTSSKNVFHWFAEELKPSAKICTSFEEFKREKALEVLQED